MLVMLMTALWKNVKCQKVLWVRRNLKRVMLRVYSILLTSLLTGFPLKATAAPQALWRLTWPRRCCAALKRSTPSCSMGLMAVPNEPTCRYTDIYGQIKTNWISLRHFENPFVDLDVQNCLHVKVICGMMTSLAKTEPGCHQQVRTRWPTKFLIKAIGE